MVSSKRMDLFFYVIGMALLWPAYLSVVIYMLIDEHSGIFKAHDERSGLLLALMLSSICCYGFLLGILTARVLVFLFPILRS